MKAIILARVSTEEQTEGQSIPAQLTRARDYAIKKDLEVASEYQFDESSTKDRRTKFEQVIEEIRKSKEKTVLVVETIDRLQRSFKESVLLDGFRKDGKLELHFIRENLIIHQNSNSSEIQRWDLGVFVAKSYVLQISDNVKRSIEQKLKNGEWIVKAPLGYLNTEDERENKNITVDPIRSLHVAKMFEMYASGNHSLRTIKKETDKVGLRSNTKANKLLTISVIARILDNPFYYGMMKIKDKLYPHKYQPLISKELFDKAQQVKAGYFKKPCKYASKPFIFRGLIKCADCGCTITAEAHKGHIYYRCTNFKKMHKKKHYVKEKELLDPVREIFKNIQLSDEKIKEITDGLRRVNEAKNQFNEQIIKGLREDYDKIEKRISNMVDARFDESITTDLYDKKLKEYKEKQQDIMDEMQKHNKADESYYITVNKVLSLAQRAYEIFESSEIEEKRQLLNFVLQNLELKERKLMFKTKTPFDTVLFANKCSKVGGYRELNPRREDHNL